MDRELTKEEVSAQIEQKTQRLNQHLDTLKHEADHMARLVKNRATDMRNRVDGRMMKIAGGVLGFLLVRKLFGGSDNNLRGVPRRTVDDVFVHRLADAVQERLRQGEGLRDALAMALRERTPVVLRSPDVHASSGGGFKGILLLAAAGAAAYYAAQRVTGQSPIDLIKDQVGSDGHEQGYRTIHGTEGARMPRADGTSPVSRATYTTVQNTPGAEMPDPNRPPASRSVRGDDRPAGSSGMSDRGIAADTRSSVGGAVPGGPAAAAAATDTSSGSSGAAGAGSHRGSGSTQQAPSVKHTEGGEMPDPDRRP